MKLGIYLNAQHPAGDDPARRFAETIEQVRLIRSLGFDSIGGGEHHVTPGVLHSGEELPRKWWKNEPLVRQEIMQGWGGATGPPSETPHNLRNHSHPRTWYRICVLPR